MSLDQVVPQSLVSINTNNTPDKDLDSHIEFQQNLNKELTSRLFQKDLALQGAIHFLRNAEKILIKNDQQQQQQQQQRDFIIRNGIGGKNVSLAVGTGLQQQMGSSSGYSNGNGESWWKSSSSAVVKNTVPNGTITSSSSSATSPSSQFPNSSFQSSPTPPPPPPPPPPIPLSLDMDAISLAKQVKNEFLQDPDSDNVLALVRFALKMAVFGATIEIPLLPDPKKDATLVDTSSDWSGWDNNQQQGNGKDPEVGEKEISLSVSKLLDKCGSQEKTEKTENDESFQSELKLLSRMALKVARSNALLQQEMEDLTATLFQQSNTFIHESMVQSHRIQRENDRMKGVIEDHKKRWQKAESEVRKLRKKLEKAGLIDEGKMDGLKVVVATTSLSDQKTLRGRRWSISGGGGTSSSVKESEEGDFASQQLVETRRGSDMQSTNNPNTSLSNIPAMEIGNSVIFIDRVALFEFQELVLFIHANATKFASTSNGEIHPIILQSSWFKKVLSEEIEPLLNSLVFAGSNGKTLSGLRKKFLDLCLMKISSINLEEREFVKKAISEKADMNIANIIGQLASSSSGRISGSNQTLNETVKMKCSYCQQNRECHFRVSVCSSSDPIFHGVIDKFCHDKVNCLITFFNTLAKIISIVGAGNHADSTPLLELFRWSLIARRGLVRARVVGMSELDYSVSDPGTTERLHILS